MVEADTATTFKKCIARHLYRQRMEGCGPCDDNGAVKIGIMVSTDNVGWKACSYAAPYYMLFAYFKVYIHDKKVCEK